jgi:hypothetical protein
MVKAAIRTFVVMLIISFSFIGSDCNEILENVGNSDCTGSQVDIIGTWKFVFNAGGIRDICLGETVEFTSGGTAFLTCPGQQTIQRSYSVSSDFILTYTSTNVKYCLSGNTEELQLTGLNNNRILVYQKVITSGDTKKENTKGDGNNFNNSSEQTK